MDRASSNAYAEATGSSAVRSTVVARLQARMGELEEAIFTRVYAVSEPIEDAPEYVEGLRLAVVAAVNHGLTALERNCDRLPIPTALLGQARLAARLEVPLDTVLRRYFAGYTVLLDFIVEEVRTHGGAEPDVIRDLVRGQSVVHERVVEAVSEEYSREPKTFSGSAAELRAGLVRRLLAGERIDASAVRYDFETSCHVGLLGHGSPARDVIARLLELHECQRLMVDGSPGVTWAWLGSRRSIEVAAIADEAVRLSEPGALVAIGEPGQDLAGWRLTHRQARAAMTVAVRGGTLVVRYADVALGASILQDDLLAASLRSLYLGPLAAEQDGGEMARRTLRAYFKAGCNISSAAAALGANRQTVSKRLRAIDDRLGGVLGSRSADLQAALCLDELTSSAGHLSPPAC